MARTFILIVLFTLTACFPTGELNKVNVEILQPLKDPNIKYSTFKGIDFVFLKKGSYLNKYGLVGWYSRKRKDRKTMKDKTTYLSYEKYAGMKGRLNIDPSMKTISLFAPCQMAVLENDEIVYVNPKLIKDHENNGYICRLSTLLSAKKLIGKIIWVKRANSFLWNLDASKIKTSYLEKLIVKDIVVEANGKLRGSGPFYLLCANSKNETGFVAYNPELYFYEKLQP